MAFDIDKPGKDSHVHREAGASEVLVASSRRWALIHELRDEPEPSLAELLSPACPLSTSCSWRASSATAIPKLEVHRPSLGKPLLQPGDPCIKAVASDAPLGRSVPVLDLNDPAGIADFLLRMAIPVQCSGRFASRTT